MASLAARLADLATAVATDIKQLRVWMTGSSSGDLTGLTTTAKTSVVAAINEVKAGATGAPPSATTSAQGVIEIATLAEVAAGTDTVRAVTPEGVRQERAALKTEIMGGIPSSTLDTIYELAAALTSDESAAATLTTLVGTKANSSDVYTQTQIGNPDQDLVAVYNAAKA